MDRRTFVKSSGVVAAAAVAQRVKAGAPAVASLVSGRTVLPLNRNWRYSPTSKPEHHTMEFNDSAFARVTLPHTNVMLPWHSFEDKTYEFVSTYRRQVKMPAGIAGKRVFVDFEGAMTAATVWFNDARLGEYRGGYTPFSFEVTDHVRPAGKNVLSVGLDSTERKDIPPFGNQIDYLTFGGIYREVALRVVPQIFIENVQAVTRDVLSGNPSVEVRAFLDRPMGASPKELSIHVELRKGEEVLGQATAPVELNAPSRHHPEDADQAMGAVPFDVRQDGPSAVAKIANLGGKVELWDLRAPHLYTVVVRLMQDGKAIDEDSRRIGFREAMFTPQGFSLNGKVIKLHGLDRHQTFPWVGQAMPARVQRQDAIILRKDLRCNIVRTSHYPQSRHFLDACDEIGLLVLEEIPGWQHIGDEAWQDVAVDNVRRMVRRDWNHPAVILWGVRINESRDNHDFYVRTNALGHALDSSRQTGGIRNFMETELLEDVMTMNDFGWPLRKPNHPLYLNTEFVGHTFPTKTFDSHERLREHTLRHARIHDQLASDPQYAGGIGWCAFDYNTHANFGGGDRICYHGVMDMFRTPKPAAGFYRSLCERDEEIVMEPAFHWARNDESSQFSHAFISSNVDTIRMTMIKGGKEFLLYEGGPDRVQFPHLKHPPFDFKVKEGGGEHWGDMKLEGMVDGKVVITKMYGGDGADKKFTLTPDETTLVADGVDCVRVVLRVEDAYGNVRPFANDAILLEVDGPGEIVGDNPFGLVGGTGAVWLKVRESAGTVVLRGRHPHLGTASATFTLKAAPPETA